MKKIFAICAVALVAGAMFTSCKKDAENAMTVKFNKESWTAGEVLGNQIGSILGLEAYENNSNDKNCAFVYGDLGTAAGTYNNYKFMFMENYGDTNSEGWPNWNVQSQSQEITAIDLALHTIDATVAETLKQDGKDDADLKITMKNTEWVIDTLVSIQTQTKGKARRR